MSESKGRKHAYEAMFVVSPTEAADLAGIVDHLNEILRRATAEVIALKKWDERRLAYEIGGQKRGVYFLAFFICDPVNIGGIERDCNLSERILRTLITRADHLTVEEMQNWDGHRELAVETELRRTRDDGAISPEEAEYVA